MDEKIYAEDIKAFLLKDCFAGFDFKTTEMAPYHTDIRFDVIGIQRYNRSTRIYEVKSCRQDFLSDKKWEKYLPFSTYFYFAAPRGAIMPCELPEGVGLIEFSRLPNGYIQHEYVKKCKKQPPISEQNYIKLIEAAFMRMQTLLKKLKEDGER